MTLSRSPLVEPSNPSDAILSSSRFLIILAHPLLQFIILNAEDPSGVENKWRILLVLDGFPDDTISLHIRPGYCYCYLNLFYLGSYLITIHCYLFCLSGSPAEINTGILFYSHRE